MDIFMAIEGRRSIRNYSAKPVEEEKLKKVLEAARLSPSANNAQNWKFVVVRDPETRAKLTEATMGQSFAGEAPVMVAACGLETERQMACGQYRYSVDLSIATAYMILAAHALGLGTCWLGRFNEKQVKEILAIPDEARVVALFPLGYPAEEPAAKPRKSMDEIVCYEKYE